MNSGPVLRHRIAVDLMNVSDQERKCLLSDSLATPEVQRWLTNLRESRFIHGSQDTHTENAFSKLLDFGLNCANPAFAESAKHLLDCPFQIWDSLVLLPFLVRAGCIGNPRVKELLTSRFEKLHQTVQRGCFDFYLNAEEASGVPKAWQGKPIYRDEFGHQEGYPLPTCYDFYTLAYCPAILSSGDFPSISDSIVAFLSDTRFQSTEGGYGWDKAGRRCYAAGRVFLACVTPARLVLFLELGARFNSARQSTWFQQGLSSLEKYRTSRGTYIFPSRLLMEKTGYQMYGGSHMGLGENRHSHLALELESTFHMLYIHKRMQNE